MTSPPWPAPRATGPVSATVEVPGSKSVTNRALVLATLAAGESSLLGALDSRDTRLMAAALGVLGVEVCWAGTTVRVRSAGPPYRPAASAVDVGNAGTVARFFPALAGLATGRLRLDGDPRIRERPVGPLLGALAELGVTISAAGERYPLQVTGHGRVHGGAVTLDASASSQFVSGLLLAGPAYDEGVQVTHRGPRLPSRPHLAMTVAMLRAAGAGVGEPARDCWVVRPGGLRAGQVVVEPDLSTAAPFLAAALVTGGEVTVPGWPAASTQPGTLLPALLERIGARCTLDQRGLTVVGTGRLAGLDADLADAPELVPVLAALGVLAEGPSRLRGIGHLRGQETDRLAALARELGRLGAQVTEQPDGLRIVPGRLTGTLFRTYDDHRLAMAAAVLGLAVDGVLVENVPTTGKTFPGFAERWAELLH